MHHKIIFFDIDGTLVDEEKKIPQTAEEAVKELKRNGAHVVIATGRPPFMFENLREQLEIDSYISFSGQHVVFEGETIYKKPMEMEAIKQLHIDSMKYDFPMIYMSDQEMRATIADNDYIKEGLGKLKFYYPEVDQNFHLADNIYQVLMFCEENEEDHLVTAHNKFNFLRWHKYTIDILPSGGSKAIGVNRMIEASGLDIANSYAFGDGLNDLEMIQEVGTGIAMGNARPEVKAVADYTTDRVENDGVLKGLQKYSLV